MSIGRERMIHFVYRILNFKHITSRLFLLVILLIFLSCCLHLFLYMSIDKKSRLDATELDLEYALTNQSLIMENWASERAQEIRYLANLPISKELQLEQMTQTFQDFAHSHEDLASIVFLDKDGHVVIDSARKEPILHSDISLQDRDYFRAGQQGREYIHDVVVSKATGKPAIIFSAPVLSASDQFQGVIFGAAHLSKVNELLSQSIQGESGEITLVNQEGVILAHLANNTDRGRENQALATHLDTEIADKILTEEINVGETFPHSYVNFHGDEVIGAFVPLYDERYFLINEISEKEVLQPHYQMIFVILSVTLVIFGVGVLLIIPISKHLLRPLIYLVEAIRKMRAGKYSTQLDPNAFKSSPLELQQIMQTFNEMAATIQENNKALQKLSSTDELTGIANRRIFDEHLAREWLHARREQKPISLAFLDLDFFKEYNDNFGHQAGDQCLIKVSQAIKDSTKRPRDLVARYGGEEFVLILPETNSAEATVVAERARNQVENLQIQHSRSDVNRYVTVSIGVATMIPSETMEKESLIELADQAVYEAKSKGRNTIITKGSSTF